MNDRTIMTYSGKMFDFWNPKQETICIEDIAHAMSMQIRFNGHTRVPYSVAEHCVRMSYLTVGNPLINLLHDAAEAYVGDIASPQKKYLGWYEYGYGFRRDFKDQEHIILEVIGEALGVQNLSVKSTCPEIKKADRIMLVTEMRDLMPENARTKFKTYFKGMEPLPKIIRPWVWAFAEREYLNRYEVLKNAHT